jgi:hypothetical protein
MSGLSIEGDRESGKDVRANNGSFLVYRFSESSHVRS